MAASISLFLIETFHFYQVCCAFYCKGLTNLNDLPLNSNEIITLILYINVTISVTISFEFKGKSFRYMNIMKETLNIDNSKQ